MKKLVLATIAMLGLIIGMPASANNTQKINLVKKLYQQANMRTNSDDIVHKVATVDFQNHLRHAENSDYADKYDVWTRGGFIVCQPRA